MSPKYSYEYIFLDSRGRVRGKNMTTADFLGDHADALPVWNADGSSVGLAETVDSEIWLRPVCVVVDPWRSKETDLFAGAWLVMCDTLLPTGEPHPLNMRPAAKAIFDRFEEEDPWFGLELEFFLMDREGVQVWDVPRRQGRYYNGVGAENVFCMREVVEDMFCNALRAGLELSGYNAEVAPGQWEIQLGIVKGITAADHFHLLMYIMQRTAEDRKYGGLKVNFSAKPLGPDWNGSGCHTNFSTASMRAKGAKDAGVFDRTLQRLEQAYPTLVPFCGRHNEERMTGQHETAQLDTFTWGVGSRSTSVRIPTMVDKAGCGYMEFRVPNCEMDVYSVLSRIVEAVCGTE